MRKLLKWIKPRKCDNSGPNCFIVTIDGDPDDDNALVYISNDTDPKRGTAVGTVKEFRAFEESIRNGQDFLKDAAAANA